MKTHDSSSVRDLLKVALCVAGLILAGSLDYQDQVEAEKAYCKNVSTGQWPDFKRIYSTTCAAHLKKGE